VLVDQIRSGTTATAIWPARSSSCHERQSSPSSAPQSPTASQPSPRSLCRRPILRCRSFENRGQKAGVEGGRDRRQRQRRGLLGSEIPSRVGQGRRARACPCSFNPQGVPELNKQLAGNGWLTTRSPIRWRHDDRALSHLIFEGTFDRFPKLKVIAAHGGGFLPSYADRSDHACLVNPGGCNPNIKLAKAPTEYLKQIYFDSLVFTPEALRHLAAQVGAARSCWAATIRFPGSSSRWTIFSPRHRLATTTRPTPRPHRGRAAEFQGVDQHTPQRRF